MDEKIKALNLTGHKGDELFYTQGKRDRITDKKTKRITRRIYLDVLPVQRHHGILLRYNNEAYLCDTAIPYKGYNNMPPDTTLLSSEIRHNRHGRLEVDNT